MRAGAAARFALHTFRAAGIVGAVSVVGCSPVGIVNAIAAGKRPAIEGVAYGPTRRQKLDVYRPSPTTRPRPIVVFFYGGSWRGGDRAEYRFAADAFASAGFVVVVPDYRVYPQVTFPEFVEDGARAVRWTRDHAAEVGGDRDRLFLVGHSAGAHVAAMLTLDRHYLDNAGVPRDAIRGTVGLAGPYDFKLRPKDRPVFKLTSATQPTVAAQPITYVDGTSPPMLLIQGAADGIVNPNNTPRLADAIRARGGDVSTITYSKQGHVSLVLSLAHGFRWLAPTRDDAIAFITARAGSSPATRPAP